MVLKALLHESVYQTCVPIVFGDVLYLQGAARKLGLQGGVELVDVHPLARPGRILRFGQQRHALALADDALVGRHIAHHRGDLAVLAADALDQRVLGRLDRCCLVIFRRPEARRVVCRNA